MDTNEAVGVSLCICIIYFVLLTFHFLTVSLVSFLSFFFFLLYTHYLNKLFNKKITKKSANTVHLSLDPVLSPDKPIINLRCNQLFSVCVCIDVCVFVLHCFVSKT